jgi:hypothetical protein
MKTKIIIFYLLFCPIALFSQDFSHISSGRLFYNSSFAGASIEPKLAIDYQGQGLNNYTASQAHVSYDQYIRQIRSGLGFYISDIWFKDNFIGYNYSHISYYGIFSPSINVAKKFMLKPSIYFGSNTDKYDSPAYPYQLPDPITYKEIGGGLLVYSFDMYAGISFRNMNKAKVNSNTIPVEMILNFGGVIGKKDIGSKAVLIFPFLVYDEISKYDEKLIKFGLDSRIHSFLLGIHMNTFGGSINSPDYMSALIGFNLRHLRFAYSYDFVTSKTSVGTSGKHEVSLVWSFKLKNVPANVIPLPEMGF